MQINPVIVKAVQFHFPETEKQLAIACNLIVEKDSVPLVTLLRNSDDPKVVILYEYLANNGSLDGHKRRAPKNIE